MAGRIKGIEQARAKKAYDNVKELIDINIDADGNWDEFIKKYDIKKIKEKDIKKGHDKLKKKYKSGAKKLPILIKTNGLGQSLAFIYNRDDGWKIIYQQLTEWLREKQLINNNKDNKDKDNKEDIDLLKKVTQMESNEYRQLTIECISFLNWLRRFVDGLMDDVKEEN